MKIVYLYPSLAITGGIERILVDKMNWLARHGDDVYIITSDQGMHRVPYLLDERVHFKDMNIRFHTQYRYSLPHRLWVRWRMFREYHVLLRQAFREIQPDVIVTATSQGIRSLLTLRGKTPLVVESHVNFSHPDTLLHRLQNRVNHFWMSRAQAIVTLTEGDARDWRRISSRVHVIPNIVHLAPAPIPLPRGEGENASCRCIFVGRLVEQKGLPDLLAVWHLVHQRHPDWQLHIYGEGDISHLPLLPSYQEEGQGWGLLGVSIHPPVSNIFEKYQESAMLLLTSVYEPFGLVMPEAMSCGLPVVAFDCPHGPATIIHDGEDGFLVSNRDRQAFADRVCQLIEDPALRWRMGSNAVQSSRRFTPDAIMPRWQNLFKSL